MILRKVSFLFCLMLTASAAPGSSETAFGTFKGFEGKWAIGSGQKIPPFEMTYEIGSKGSIVTEQFGKELSVFYRDGQGLLMTHFRNAGNSHGCDCGRIPPPGVFEFQTFDITNLPSAGCGSRCGRRLPIRAYLGRDHETKKRNYHNRTVVVDAGKVAVFFLETQCPHENPRPSVGSRR